MGDEETSDVKVAEEKAAVDKVAVGTIDDQPADDKHTSALVIAPFVIAVIVLGAGIAVVADRAAIADWKTAISVALTVYGGLLSAFLFLMDESAFLKSIPEHLHRFAFGNVGRSAVIIILLAAAGAGLLRYGLSHQRVYVECVSTTGETVKADVTIDGRTNKLECTQTGWVQAHDKVTATADGYLPLTAEPVVSLIKEGHLRVVLRPRPKWGCAASAPIAEKTLDDTEAFELLCGVPAAGKHWTQAMRYDLLLTAANGVVATDSTLNVTIEDTTGPLQDGKRGVGLRSKWPGCEPGAYFDTKPAHDARMFMNNTCVTRDKLGMPMVRLTMTLCGVDGATTAFDDQIRLRWLPKEGDPHDVPCVGR